MYLTIQVYEIDKHMYYRHILNQKVVYLIIIKIYNQ